MACDKPLNGYRSGKVSKNGKYPLIVTGTNGPGGMQIPCGRCTGCRIEHSRQWAIRLVHEASLHEQSQFLTLTYDEENIPADRSLRKTHFQQFMKRYRKWLDKKISFFHCGEYGSQLNRPHYHAIIFGHSFGDKYQFGVNPKTKDKYYRSERLEKLWPFGYSTIGDVTFQSCAYVARYVMKKQTGKKAEQHYQIVDSETGELYKDLQPEYSTCSLKPAIGKGWFEKYESDVFPDDFVVLNGKKYRVPRYYDKLRADWRPWEYELAVKGDFNEGNIRDRRIQKGKENAHENTPERRLVRATVRDARLSRLKRGYENA